MVNSYWAYSRIFTLYGGSIILFLTWIKVSPLIFNLETEKLYNIKFYYVAKIYENDDRWSYFYHEQEGVQGRIISMVYLNNLCNDHD